MKQDDLHLIAVKHAQFQYSASLLSAVIREHGLPMGTDCLRVLSQGRQIPWQNLFVYHENLQGLMTKLFMYSEILLRVERSGQYAAQLKRQYDLLIQALCEIEEDAELLRYFEELKIYTPPAEEDQ